MPQKRPTLKTTDPPLPSPRPLLARWLCPPGPPVARLYQCAGASVLAVPGRYGVSYLLLGQDSVTVVDCGSAADVQPILAAMGWLDREPGQIRHVIPSHLHFDHMMGVDVLAQTVGASVTLGRVAWEHVCQGRPLRWPQRRHLLRAVPVWSLQGSPVFPAADLRGGRDFGFPWARNRFRSPLSAPLHDGQPVPGLEGWVAIETPGHSDDGICLYHGEAGFIVAGDTLRNFLGGELNPMVTDVGDFRRTRRRLAALDVRLVFPGHGPTFAPPGGVGAMETLPWWMP